MERRTFLRIAPTTALMSTLGDTAGWAEAPAGTPDVAYVAPGSISGPLARGLMPPAGEPPLPKSRTFRGLRFTGRERAYTETMPADTWYPSWGADGRLYTSYADGGVRDASGRAVTVNSQWQQPGGLRERWFRDLGYAVEAGRLTTRNDRATTTGTAILDGADPFDLSVTPLQPFRRETPRYEGYYPCANLLHKGVWYYGGYYCHRWLNAHNVPITYELGGFGGFRISADGGRSWRDTPHDDRSPLFPEVGRCSGGAPIRLGTPHFVDFGRDLEHSPDGYAYLVGHGSYGSDGVANWCSGDAISLARVRPSPGTINDPDAWEFFAGRDGSAARWTRDFTQMRPVISWPGGAGCVNITYQPALRRYFGFICGGWQDGDAGPYNIWVVESAAITGPWSSVACLRGACGGQPYFVAMPGKFNRDASRRLVLFYSANWRKERPGTPARIDPAGPGGAYALCVAEFELL